MTQYLARPIARPVLASLIAVVAASCSTDAIGPQSVPHAFSLEGLGAVNDRYTAELNVRGNVAYTSTWSSRNGNRGNAVKVWNVSGPVPAIVDSVIVANAGTTGDVVISDDGTFLMVAIEQGTQNGIALYSLASPTHPQLITRYATANTANGVHTAEFARVDGKPYGFLQINAKSSAGSPAKLVIVDLSTPSAPVEVLARVLGRPSIHDVFVRDGVLFTAEWNDGTGIWDIGGLGRGGSVSNPIKVATASTINGEVHNIWWFKDAAGNKKYLFVGEEGPGDLETSIGDVHVVDVSTLTAPKEVAVYGVPGAGTHNFSMDESRGVLYAAYYNAGVRALDVRGDLGTCTAAQKRPDGRCDLKLMGREIAAFDPASPRHYVWGVQFIDDVVYASDMLNGLYKLSAVAP